MDKSGATQTSILIGLLLGLAVILAVGYFIWKGIAQADTASSLILSDLEKFRLACSGYVSLGSVNDFCYTFREGELASGKKTYFNCQYTEVYSLLKTNERFTDAECGGTADVNAKSYCEKLKTDEIQNFETRSVNKKTCKDWEVTSTSATTSSSSSGGVLPPEYIPYPS